MSRVTDGILSYIPCCKRIFQTRTFLCLVVNIKAGSPCRSCIPQSKYPVTSCIMVASAVWIMKPNGQEFEVVCKVFSFRRCEGSQLDGARGVLEQSCSASGLLACRCARLVGQAQDFLEVAADKCRLRHGLGLVAFCPGCCMANRPYKQYTVCETPKGPT